MSGITVSVITLHRFKPLSLAGFDGTTLIPFQLMVAFVMGFRLIGAFNKFEAANEAVLNMHAGTRKLMNRLMCYCAASPEVDETLVKIRRLLVLSCVLVKKHVRVEKSFDLEARCGLVTKSELEAMTETAVTRASMPGGDGFTSRYPSRNRSSFAFYHIQHEVVKLFRDGHLPSSPHCAGLDAVIDQLSDTLERVELIGLTMAPLPYAQVTRWITLAFLVFLPFESVAKMWSQHDTERSAILRALDMDIDADEADEAVRAHLTQVRIQMYLLTAILSTVTNFIYFAIDEVATQLETPFGRDENDIDFDKMLRRIDKHTAAQLALRLGRPVPHYDLYPIPKMLGCFSRYSLDLDRRESMSSEGQPKPPRSFAAQVYRRTVGRLLSSLTTGKSVTGNDHTYYIAIETARLEAEASAKAEKEEVKRRAWRSVWSQAARAAEASQSPASSMMKTMATVASLHHSADVMRSLRDPVDGLPDAQGLEDIHEMGINQVLEGITEDMMHAALRIQACYRGTVSRRRNANRLQREENLFEGSHRDSPSRHRRLFQT